jgi:post-segregation antitoxin (ccd killing protein)
MHQILPRKLSPRGSYPDWMTLHPQLHRQNVWARASLRPLRRMPHNQRLRLLTGHRPFHRNRRKKAATDAVNAFLDENNVLKDKVRDIQFSKTIPTQLEKDVLQNKAREWVRHLQAMAIRTAQEYLDAELKKHPTEVIAKKQAPPVGVPYEKEHPEVTRARDLLEQALQSDLGIAVATEREEYGKLNQYELANKQLKEAKIGSRQYADAQNRANRIAAELPDYSEKSVQAWLVARSHERGDTAKARRCQKSLNAAQVRLDWARKLATQSLQEIGPPTQRSSY